MPNEIYSRSSGKHKLSRDLLQGSGTTHLHLEEKWPSYKFVWLCSPCYSTFHLEDRRRISIIVSINVHICAGSL
jgi:hypothetical protein